MVRLIFVLPVVGVATLTNHSRPPSNAPTSILHTVLIVHSTRSFESNTYQGAHALTFVFVWRKKHAAGTQSQRISWSY
ncbi:hypothetical protein EDD15DRAFT_605245 [Pisolithus albus]|nr:hypothetical protein EDD15DRAFT_605245 [Pisolithus albus]